MTLRERIQEWLENTSDPVHDKNCDYWQNGRCDCDRSGARPLLREVLAGASPAPQIASQIAQRVAELPDRTSPDDWPEAMLVTAEELSQIVADVLAGASHAEEELQETLREVRNHIRKIPPGCVIDSSVADILSDIEGLVSAKVKDK